MASSRAWTAGLIAGGVLVSGCSGGSGNPTGPEASTTAVVPGPTVAGTVARGLEAPWGLAFLPGSGSALVSLRDSGRIVRVVPGAATAQVGTVPGVVHDGEGGLLGIALSPTYSRDRLVYAYLTTARDNRIVRMRYARGRLGAPQGVIDGIPAGNHHDGGRIAFGPDGMLYAGTGETGETGLAQDSASLGGKILRMTPDGRPAPGNPTPGSVVFSTGHRNVQGLAFDSRGRLFASEFGQDTWDELNLVRAGDNDGWPEVEGKADDSGAYVAPLTQWHTDEASPSGIAIDAGAVWMAGLRGERLWRIPLVGAGVGTPTAYFDGTYGRLRTVALAPDGSLWVITNNTDGRGDPGPADDRILRVVPPR